MLSGRLGSDLLCLLLRPVMAQECKQVEYGATVGPSPQTGVVMGNQGNIWLLDHSALCSVRLIRGL